MNKIKFVYFDWGGTLAKSGTRNEFIYDARIQKKLATLNPGVFSLFNHLRKNGVGIGLLSNMDKCILCMNKALIKTGLHKYFDFILYSNNPMLCKKPCNKIFKIGIQLSGCHPKHILYVGNDYIKDVLGGYRSGMQTCLIPNRKKDLRMALLPSNKGGGKQTYLFRNLSQIKKIT